MSDTSQIYPNTGVGADSYSGIISWPSISHRLASMNTTDSISVQSSSRGTPGLARNYAYVLTGLPVALVSFPLLVSLTVVSVATLVVWVGIFLLPLTLLIASAFADLSRRRLNAWGRTVTPVHYRPIHRGLLGKLRIIVELRRWLDLLFETLIAFPMRIINFVLAVVWTAGGLGGVTYFFWSIFIPGQRPIIQLLQHILPTWVPQTQTGQYLLDSGVMMALGLIFLLTLSRLLATVAVFDGFLTEALLGATHNSGDYQEEDEQTRRSETVGVSSTAVFSASAWAWTGTIFAAVVLVAVGWPVLTVVYSLNTAVVMVWVVLQCTAIVVTLRWTVPGLVLAFIASGCLMAITAAPGVAVWPWPVTVLLTQCAVLIVAGMMRPWYYAVSAWCASVLLTLAVLFVAYPRLPDGTMANSIVFASVSAGAVVVAILTRSWIRNAGRLKVAEQTSVIQGRRSKELAERNRIARELHDVVAHSMSVISVQAATARYRNPDIDDASQKEFEDIADSSRQALAEMRSLLSILRNDDAPPTVPTPKLADIDALVEATRASGTVIEYHGLDIADDTVLEHTPPATALAAYRTVQEALSNALRHAPGTTVHVELRLTSDSDNTHWIDIRVSNGPRGNLKTSETGSGLGLTGIRERIAAVGGSYESGPTREGGFAVSARLPVERAQTILQ